MRMLFNRNDICHHLIMSKTLKSFFFNFTNWCFLRETCAYPHFPMWKNHECCLPLNIFSSWVFGFGPPQACILSLRTIRCQHTNPFWIPDPDQFTLVSWRSDGGCWDSRTRADSPTHSRLTGIGLWGIVVMNQSLTLRTCHVTLDISGSPIDFNGDSGNSQGNMKHVTLRYHSVTTVAVVDAISTHKMRYAIA